MIDGRDDEGFEVTCDQCEHCETHTNGFWVVIGDLKERGWIIRKNDSGDWLHYCPDCVMGGKQMQLI